MDTFTLSVIIGNAAILLIFLLMVIFDKKTPHTVSGPAPVTGPGKPAGKRPA